MATLNQQQPTSPQYAMSPLSEDSRISSPTHGAPSVASAGVHTGHSRKPTSLKEDDDAFLHIAMALLERRHSKNLSAQNAIDSTLLPHERRAFWEALHFRKAQLPMFAEANEDAINQVLRDVERLFGSILRSSTDMTSPASQGEFLFDARSPTSQVESTASIHSTAKRIPHGEAQQQHPHVPPAVTMPNGTHPMLPSSQQYQQASHPHAQQQYQQPSLHGDPHQYQQPSPPDVNQQQYQQPSPPDVNQQQFQQPSPHVVPQQYQQPSPNVVPQQYQQPSPHVVPQQYQQPSPASSQQHHYHDQLSPHNVDATSPPMSPRQPSPRVVQQQYQQPCLDGAHQQHYHHQMPPHNVDAALPSMSPRQPSPRVVQQQYQQTSPDGAQQQHYHHQRPPHNVDAALPPMSPCQPYARTDTRSQSSFPRLATRGSTISVETQKMQNLSPGEQYHQQQYQPRNQPMETQYQLFDDHQVPTMQQASPRYKQYRPPALQLQPSFVSVVAPPPQIDIDWNIPIKIVNEGNPIREKKSIRFRDEPELQAPVQHEKPFAEQSKLPDSASPTSKHHKKSFAEQSKFPDSASPTSKHHEKSFAEQSKFPYSASPTSKHHEKSFAEQSKFPDSASPTSKHVAAAAAEKIEKEPETQRVAQAVKNDYRLDIARNKCILVFNEAETTSKQIELRKKLLDEIDRVTNLLSSAHIPEEQAAYEAYRTELRIELEKWNRASEFGSQKGPQNDSVIGAPQFEQKLVLKKSQSFVTEGLTTVGSELPPVESIRSEPKKNPLLNKQITARDQFPDVRKQWRTVNIMAPYTLPEGFQFEARVADEIFMATVPRGGVAEGEVFATRMGDIHGDTTDAAQRTRVFKDMDAPPSRWRDELFDCFRHGFFHDFLWNSILCPHVALSQIMARIQLSDTMDPIYTIRSRTRACRHVLFALLLVAVHVFYGSYLLLAGPDDDAIMIATFPLVGLDVLILVYFLCMVIKTRKTVRREYDIPELRCHGHEDCCMAVFCTCCTISQMGRHTADYETYRSYCCTDTGLANHVEVKLPCEYLNDVEHGAADNKRDQSTYRRL